MKATRARYRVVAFTVALAAVTYFDRVCISTLAPIVVGVLVERFANWSLPLYVMAVLYAFSSVCWLFVDPRPRTG